VSPCVGVFILWLEDGVRHWVGRQVPDTRGSGGKVGNWRLCDEVECQLATLLNLARRALLLQYYYFGGFVYGCMWGSTALGIARWKRLLSGQLGPGLGDVWENKEN
jgi:hypothetical protein